MTGSSDHPGSPGGPPSSMPPSPDGAVDLRPPADAVFRTDDLEADLPRRSVRSGATVVGAQGVLFVLNMVGVAILARLLTPEDFGLIEMVAILLTLVQCFQEMGLGESTVQQAHITHRQISTLFWINAAVGFACAGLMAVLAWPVAWFFERSELIGITLALSITFVFAGLAAQHQALLRRRMRFGTVSGINIAANVIGLGAGVAAALYGTGYWSLVIMRLGVAVGRLAGSWITAGWIPGRPGPLREVASMLRFGGYLTGAIFIGSLTRTVDRLIIGRTQSADVLGQYAKAYQILMLPIVQLNLPINTVAVPTLSRLQHDPERFRLYYQRGIELIATMAMPIVFGSLAAAETIVFALLGDQWGPAIPLFRALAPASLFMALSLSASWVFVALGRTDRQFRFRLIGSAVIITAFFIGSNWGAMGIAIAFSVAMVVTRVAGTIYCFHGTFLRLPDLLTVIWRPALAAALAGGAAAVAERLLIDSMPPLALLPVLIAILGCGYLLGWILIPGGRSRLVMMASISRYLRPGAPPGDSPASGPLGDPGGDAAGPPPDADDDDGERRA